MNSQNQNLVNNKELNILVAKNIAGINIDVITDLDIADAVYSAMISSEPVLKDSCDMSFDFYADAHKIHKIRIQGSKYNYGGKTGNAGYGLWLWHSRFGKEYQDDMEKHVARWQRPVPDFCTNLELAWSIGEKVELFDQHVMLKSQHDGEPFWFVYKTAYNADVSEFDTNKPIAMGRTPAEVICRASLVVKAEQIEQASRSNQHGYSGFAQTRPEKAETPSSMFRRR